MIISIVIMFSSMLFFVYSFCFLFDNLFKLLSLHYHRIFRLQTCFITLISNCLFFATFILKYSKFIFKTWEYHRNKRRSGINCAMGCKSIKQWSNFCFCSQVALSIVFFWNFESQFHSFY